MPGVLLSCEVFDPQPIKRERFQWLQRLNASVKNNCVLVEQSFHRMLSGDIDHAICRFLPIGKDTLNSLQSYQSSFLSGTAIQSLRYQTPRNRCLDSRHTHLEKYQPRLEQHMVWGLKVTLSRTGVGDIW